MPAVVAAAAGESLLAAEVAAPMFAADASFIPAAGALGELSVMPGMETLGGIGGLLGGGIQGALGLGSAVPAINAATVGQMLPAVSPEVASELKAVNEAIAPGANQIRPALYGSNLPAQAPNYLAQSTFPDVVSGPNPVMSEAQRRFLETSVAGNAADADVLERLAQRQGSDEIARLGGVEPGSAIDKPYVLTQTQTPNLPPAMTMEGVGGTPSSGGLMDAIKSMGSKVGQWWDEKKPEEKLLYGGTGLLAANALFGKKPGLPKQEPYSGPLSKFKYDPAYYTPSELVQPTPYTPMYRNYAEGGIMAVGTPVSDPLAYQSTGVERMASGGISNLGAYSDYARGGRMLKGPGDGMSDDIPATIAGKQPARLANEEFVIPADVVSHLGNGSSDAGAKQLYKMMDRVRQARTGTKKQGKQINPEKYLA